MATPDPLQWDCFRFGLIQRADHFTFYVSVDHLHTDGMSVGVVFTGDPYDVRRPGRTAERPSALPDPGSYDDYCVRQHQYTAASDLRVPAGTRMDPSSPKTTAEPFRISRCHLVIHRCPVPANIVTVPADGRATDSTDSNPPASQAGARFSGGVFACAALAEHELTGAETYYGITPYDTRSTPAEFMTVGWFTGLIPVTVPVTATSFGDTARAAQASFDSGKDLANVPFERVLELAPGWHQDASTGLSHAVLSRFSA